FLAAVSKASAHLLLGSNARIGVFGSNAALSVQAHKERPACRYEHENRRPRRQPTTLRRTIGATTFEIASSRQRPLCETSHQKSGSRGGGLLLPRGTSAQWNTSRSARKQNAGRSFTTPADAASPRDPRRWPRRISPNDRAGANDCFDGPGPM